MIIKCFRDNKNIDTPNSNNADYVIAEDTEVDELREVIIALKNNTNTLGKEGVDESEYDRIEVIKPEDALDAVRIVSEIQLKTIQKTGIVCPECYRETDTVIWGVHKNG